MLNLKPTVSCVDFTRLLVERKNVSLDLAVIFSLPWGSE